MRHNKLFFLLLLLFALGCKKTELSSSASTETAGSISKIRAALPHTKQFNAEVATTWYTLLTRISRYTPFQPPPTIRLFAYSGLALYESVVPGMPSYRSAYTLFSGNTIPFDGEQRQYYWPAAANAALARIVSKLLADYPNPNLAANLSAVQQLEAYHVNQFITAASAEQLQNSVSYGRLAADIIYNWSKTDGTFNAGGTLALCPPYVPVGGPGNWVPTPPGFFAAAGACQGSLRTFITGITTSTLPPAPPAYSVTPGSAFDNMMNEVYQLKQHATPNDVLNGEVWRDLVGTNYNTPAHMVQLSVNIVNKENLNLEDASVLFAKEGISLFDAIAAVFYAKYQYSLMRPLTYIRNTLGYTTWDSQYPTIAHPSYPSVAPAAAASVAAILEHYLGTSYNFIDSTQQNLYGNWPYSSLSQLVENVGRSRTHTGLNFPLAVTTGISQGRAVASQVLNLPFKKE